MGLHYNVTYRKLQIRVFKVIVTICGTSFTLLWVNNHDYVACPDLTCVVIFRIEKLQNKQWIEISAPVEHNSYKNVK